MDGFMWGWWDGPARPSERAVEQLPPALHLGVGPVTDLPPDGVGVYGSASRLATIPSGARG
jgi:hypothetical protein